MIKRRPSEETPSEKAPLLDLHHWITRLYGTKRLLTEPSVRKRHCPLDTPLYLPLYYKSGKICCQHLFQHDIQILRTDGTRAPSNRDRHIEKRLWKSLLWMKKLWIMWISLLITSWITLSDLDKLLVSENFVTLGYIYASPGGPAVEFRKQKGAATVTT
jgi:hypothetical protein